MEREGAGKKKFVSNHSIYQKRKGKERKKKIKRKQEEKEKNKRCSQTKWVRLPYLRFYGNTESNCAEQGSYQGAGRSGKLPASFVWYYGNHSA